MKQRVDRVSVQCGTVVAKNNPSNAARTRRLPPTRSRTHYTFFSIFISSHSFITIVFGRKWMCHKQTHIHDFSLSLSYLYYFVPSAHTLSTFTLSLSSSSSSSSRERWGGGIFLPFLVVMTFTIFYYYCHTTQNYLPHYYTTVS